MSDDVISRQAVIRFIREKVNLSTFMKKSIDKADKACMELCEMIARELPSAQPEIIRCKYCKHRDVEKGFCEGRGWPMQLVPDDGFCDKGERRTGE